MKSHWIVTMALCAALTTGLSGGVAVAQSDINSHTTTDQTQVGTGTSGDTVTTPPIPAAEQRDPVTAEKNLTVEEKLVQPADHDYMPSPATVPQANFKSEPTHGSTLNQTVSPEDTLVTEMPESETPSSTKGPFYNASENELRSRKFFRGAGNVLLCVAEVPNQMFQEAYKTSPVTGIVVGAFKGIWKGAKRLMIGSWEMVTFYNPGKNNYQPYIMPEVVFQEYLH